jgi:hypothetical protein
MTDEWVIKADRDYRAAQYLVHLDNYAVAVRYPGVEVSLELAQAALAAATRVRSFLRGKLEAK